MQLTESERDTIRELVRAARAFELAACDELDRLIPNSDPTTPRCPSDPCPFCTAGTELQSAYMDVEDLIEGAEPAGYDLEEP